MSDAGAVSSPASVRTRTGRAANFVWDSYRISVSRRVARLELFRPSRQQEDARCGFDAGDRAFGREPCELSFAEAVPDFFGIGDQRERMAEARRSVRIQVLFPE